MVVVVVGVGRVWTVKGHAGGEQSKKTPMPIVSASTDSLVVSVVFFWLLTQSSISSKVINRSHFSFFPCKALCRHVASRLNRLPMFNALPPSCRATDNGRSME